MTQEDDTAFDRWFHRHHDRSGIEHQLCRIADQVTRIADLLDQQPSTLRSVNIMAIPTAPLAIGDTFTFDIADVGADGTTPASTATNAAASSDDTILTVSVVDNGNGTATGTGTAVAAGDWTVTVTGTSPDGTAASTGTNNPFSGTVAAAVPDVAAVNVS